MKKVDAFTSKRLDELAKQIGMLWLNFLSLECILRIKIANNYGVSESEINKITSLKIDDVVQKNDFYNTQTLFNIIQRYNGIFSNGSVIVDINYVNIRNAFGHGFTISPNQYPIRLTNLKDEDSNTVKVVFSEDINSDYVKRINQNMAEVIEMLFINT